MALTENAEESINAALAAHNKVRRFEIDNEEHAVTMLLADLIEYADAANPPMDLGAIMERAREVVRDCQ